jgi:hypothetical protein
MTEQSDNKRIDLKTTQVAAGSLASVTSAVAASQLGVGGTLVGAGVGSVVGTVAGAVYEHYLDRTHHQVRAVMPRRAVRTETLLDDVATSVDALAADPHTEPLPVAPTEPTPAPEPPATPAGRSQPTWAWLRSRRVALGLSAAAGLGIALMALTGFEALSGQPLSAGSDEGGTSIGRVFGGGSTSDTGSDPSATPSPEASTGDESASTPTPSESSPSSSPTPQPSTPSTSPTTEPVPDPTPPNGG